ncbi:cation diffusion facilitator family transporter [Eubacteriales bacterium OttesenSCG-928-A19]|nr:cation diffusion facilitator family transporter [Eubacteriales bacterium OttesenSCG-928-A19]
MKKQFTHEATAMTVSRNSIVGNVTLFAAKMAAGILGHSAAMVSDAIHSLSDVLSTFVVIVGIKLAGRQADASHPYGHERFESVAAMLLAFLLGITGVGIGISGVQTIITGTYRSITLPTALPLIAAIVSIAVKEGMYWYTRNAAKRINSSALMADAWHHRSDAFSSIGSLVGIAGAMLGFPVMDAIASVIICVFIVKAAVDIFRDAVGKMTDKACPDDMVQQMRETVLGQDGVIGVDLLQTRLFGDKVYVDVEIAADGNATLAEGHAIAGIVHDSIEKGFPEVKHCMVHVNPHLAEELG